MLDFEQFPRFKMASFQIVTLIPQWAKAYEVETEAIIRQIPIAHAWCNSNPKKAPKTNPVRFLHNWMRIAKKMGNLVSRQPDRRYKEQATEEDMSVEEMIEIRKRNMAHVP